MSSPIKLPSAIQLGDTVTDSITGKTGVVTGVAFFLFGCTRLTIEGPEMKDGEAMWLDEQRVTAASPAPAGGPHDDATRPTGPRGRTASR